MATVLYKNALIVTMKNGRYHALKNAQMCVKDGKILSVGEICQNIPSLDEEVDVTGRVITPGLIDCHTHSVFGGNRAEEFERRLQGVSYGKIAAEGGGIASTVRLTQQASIESLFESALTRIQTLQKDGVTGIEIKSGYGLDFENERKMLEVINQLKSVLPMRVSRTYLAAHAIPPEYKANPDDYIALVCEQFLPRFAQLGLMDAVDVFCEHLAFNLEQVEKVFKASQYLNIPVKIHAEQLTSMHGSTLGAKYSALSADHLEHITESDVKAMAESGTVAVLLPGASYFLRETSSPSIELLRKYNVAMAISTDLNPGTSPALSLRLMMNMAATLFRMTPEETLAGVTINAAKALGWETETGSLEVGKSADFVIWDIESPSELSYWLGGNLSKSVYYQGKEVFHD